MRLTGNGMDKKAKPELQTRGKGEEKKMRGKNEKKKVEKLKIISENPKGTPPSIKA